MSESGKVVAELTRMLDLREQQLADCTRAMRVVSTELKHELAPITCDMGAYYDE